MSEKILEDYKLGDINVRITELSDTKVLVTASDNQRKMSFEARLYDYQNYNRLMNQKIKQRFLEARESES